MSFEPRRSVLSVPAHIPRFAKKAALSDVDVVMFDLEDSVPVDKKIEARDSLIDSVKENEWGSKVLTFRCNPVESVFCFEDIIEVVGACGNVLNSVVVPKVDSVAEVHFVDKLLDSVEQKYSTKNRVGIEVSIESAEGLNVVSELAEASDRIKTLVFGIADYSTSVEAKLVSISGHGENEEEIYPGHRWHYVLSRMVMAAKANGLMVIDAPFGNFSDNDGLRKSAGMSAAIGVNGKWAIHPNQIETINEIFSPSEEEIRRAVTIIEAETEAGKNGYGAVAIEGRMVDKATIRLAHKQIEVAKRLGKI